MRKVGINGFPVTGSDGVESLGKPSMLHYIDGIWWAIMASVMPSDIPLCLLTY